MLERETKGELENKGKRNAKNLDVKCSLLTVIKQLKQSMIAKR